MNCRRCSCPLDAEKAAEELAAGVLLWNVCGPCVAAEADPPAAADAAPHVAFTRHLRAAHGFLDLGLPHEAWNELEAIEPPSRRAEMAVLGLRVAIFYALERWGAMAEVCRHLATVEPGQAGWVLSLAYAVRRAEGSAAARDVLLRAAGRFPGEAAIPFNLACHAAQAGDMEDAKRWLRRAVALEGGLKQKALDDPDLDPLWESMGQL